MGVATKALSSCMTFTDAVIRGHLREIFSTRRTLRLLLPKFVVTENLEILVANSRLPRLPPMCWRLPTTLAGSAFTSSAIQ